MRRSGWFTLAVAINAILATVSQGQTNSFIGTTNGFWDESRLWSLEKPPSIKQSAILITNDASETVTIDSTTAHDFRSTMTVSNLTIAPPSGSADTLYLDNTSTIALHILNDFTIGSSDGGPPDGEAEFVSSNSTLIVDGLMGGELEDDGTMVITGGALITTNCSLLVAGSIGSPYFITGFLIISDSLVEARDVNIARALPSSGTLELLGGTMTLSSSLTVGNSDGFDEDYGTLFVADECVLVVTNSNTIIESGTMTVSNASFLGDGVIVDGFESSGALVINNGTVNLNGELEIGVTSRQYGSVNLNGGMLVITNGAIDIGGYPGDGDLTVSDGLFLGQTIFLAEEGVLSIQGGTSILNSSLSLDLGSTVYVSGGQLFVTNASISIHGGFGGDQAQCIVSSGLLAANNIDLGGNFAAGTLSVNGGSVTASTGIILGDCGSDGVGYITVDDGKLIVTNAAGTGFIDVQNGQLVLSGGRLHVDKLVMTNSCGSFIHTGGKLIVDSIVLDPNAFAITSIAREGNDLRVTWMMGPGQTNALQVSSGGKHGAYTGKGFDDIFVVTNNTTAGTLTNYLDIGAATNKPSRYYRARLAP